MCRNIRQVEEKKIKNYVDEYISARLIMIFCNVKISTKRSRMYVNKSLHFYLEKLIRPSLKELPLSSPRKTK